MDLDPRHLKRYKDLVRLLLKYGRSGMAAPFASGELDWEVEERAEGEPEEASSTADERTATLGCFVLQCAARRL